jgi:leader peptidase (prepilin peptidase)/N-methyltransferase
MFLANLVVSLFGLVFGSFLGVCIYRLPRKESVLRPRSRCTNCGHALRVWDNIPVLSYILLRGKCRDCRHPLSWVYPTVEILTAVLFILLFQKYGLETPFFVNGVFFCMLIVLSFIDLYHRILPNVITFGGVLVGLLLSPFQSAEFLHAQGAFAMDGWYVTSYVNSALGVAIGGGLLWLVAFLYLKLRRVEGLGLGDVKMMGMVGAFLGWQYSWLTIFLGSIVGVLAGGLYIQIFGRGRRYELPFGSFLGLGAIGVTLYGPDLLNWYTSSLASS